MFARFVNGGAFPILMSPARLDRVLDLVADNSLNAIADRFILAQFVAHRSSLFSLQESSGGAKEYSPECSAA
jgi:hypothetical protein